MSDELTVTEVPDLEVLIQENSNLKKKLGDQGNEIGQLRKVTDQLLQSQVTRQDDDFYADPLENEIRGLKGELGSLKTEQRLRDLEAKHPGFRDLDKDEAFISWATSSPYRHNLAMKAQSMDFDAAEELLSAWEDSRESATRAQASATQQRTNDLKAATMEKGASGGGRKQYYSRTELINLRINNPQKYEAMLPEIKAAYLEGRVRK